MSNHDLCREFSGKMVARLEQAGVLPWVPATGETARQPEFAFRGPRM